jgi:hypothetical protein
VKQAEVLKIQRFALPVTGLHSQRQRLVVQIERLVVMPAPRGQVGQVGEVVARCTLAAIAAIELERATEVLFGALQIAQRFAYESQVVEVRRLASAVTGQCPRLQRTLVVLGGHCELAAVLVQARDVAQRVAARSMVGGRERELQRALVVAESTLQIAQGVVTGAQVTQHGCLTRSVVERAAERQAALPEADRGLGPLAVVSLDPGAADAVRLQFVGTLTARPAGEALDFADQKGVGPRLRVGLRQQLRPLEEPHAVHGVFRLDGEVEELVECVTCIVGPGTNLLQQPALVARLQQGHYIRRARRVLRPCGSSDRTE